MVKNVVCADVQMLRQQELAAQVSAAVHALLRSLLRAEAAPGMRVLRCGVHHLLLAAASLPRSASAAGRPVLAVIEIVSFS